MRTRIVALLAFGLLASCGNSVECGKGTTEVDGVCQPADTSNNSNNGTTGTNNGSTGTTGQTDITCGPNTELDAQDRCVVSDPVTCASGTQLDATNGECVVTDEVCGARTAFDGTSCLPTDEVCGDGTSFNEGLGVCLSDTECAPGDVVLRGVCVSPAEQMRDNADLTEAENNDPVTGGTPDMLTLLGEGQDLVIAGSTALPTDLDGDTFDDVDFDVFEFDGTAGQWVTVTLQPIDGPPLGFEVRGPAGYARREMGQDYGATRSFVLTEDGTYSLNIAPRSALDFGEPNAVEGDWVATVTVDAKPLPTPADYSAGIEGTFERPETAYFTELLDPSSTVNVQLQGGGDFIIYDGNDEVIAYGSNQTVIVPDTGTFNIVVDRTFARRGEPWSLVATNAVDIGTLTPPTPLTTTVADTTTGGALSLTVPAGVVPVVTQTNPLGQPTQIRASINGLQRSRFIEDVNSPVGDTALGLPIALGGGQLALNLDPGLTDVTVTVDTMPLTDEGALADGSSFDRSEPNAVPRNTYFYHKFTTASDLAWTGTLDASGADIDAELFDRTGNSLTRWTSGGGEEIAVVLPAGEYYLELRAFTELPNGFTLTSSFATATIVTETEPNDDAANANPVTLGTFHQGTAEAGGLDFYELTVATPGAYSISAGGVFNLELQNATGEVLAAGPDGLAHFLEPGTFYIVLDGPDVDYSLVVSEIAARGDVLDAGGNEDSANAQAVANLTDSVEGLINGVNDSDWYAFTVATETTVFEPVPLVVYDDQLVAIPAVDGTVTLPAGTVYVEVSGALFTPGGPSGYLLNLVPVPGITQTSSPALAIPDLPPPPAPPLPVSDVITVPQGGGPPCTISNFAVAMDITHTFASDLVIDLESPGGTVVRLWDRAPSTDIVGTFPADLQPAEPIDVFVGETASGDWTLTLTDGFGADAGTLNSWSILYDCQ